VFVPRCFCPECGSPLFFFFFFFFFSLSSLEVVSSFFFFRVTIHVALPSQVEANPKLVETLITSCPVLFFFFFFAFASKRVACSDSLPECADPVDGPLRERNFWCFFPSSFPCWPPATCPQRCPPWMFYCIPGGVRAERVLRHLVVFLFLLRAFHASFLSRARRCPPGKKEADFPARVPFFSEVTFSPTSSSSYVPLQNARAPFVPAPAWLLKHHAFSAPCFLSSSMIRFSLSSLALARSSDSALFLRPFF